MKTSILSKCIAGLCLAASLSIPSYLAAQVNTPDIKGVSDFDLSIACELTLKQGDKPSLQITGDEDALSEIYFRSFGDQLVIKSHKRNQHKEDVQITLVVPDLNKLSLSGVVDLTTPTEVNFSNLRLDVSGVANIELNLKSQKFSLDASGVLKAKIIGETKDMKLEISGTGNLNASDFKSYSCDVNISGMGDAEINVSEELEAEVSGMGKIAYTGHPRVNANTSGFGRIRKL